MNNWIKTNREALGLSRAELAKAVGASKASVGFWETGKVVPSAAYRDRLTAFFKENELAPQATPEAPKRPHKDREAGPLEAKRLAAGLSLKEVAEAVGASASAVRTWERKGYKPQQRYLSRLAELYQCTPADLGFPDIRNGLTVEERNAIVMELLDTLTGYVIACNRSNIFLPGVSMDDVRQDIAMGILEAVNRMDPSVGNRNYVIKWAERTALRGIQRTRSHGLVGLPPGVSIVFNSMEALAEAGFLLRNDDADEWD